jgi:hypothetical protein
MKLREHMLRLLALRMALLQHLWSQGVCLRNIKRALRNLISCTSIACYGNPSTLHVIDILPFLFAARQRPRSEKARLGGPMLPPDQPHIRSLREAAALISRLRRVGLRKTRPFL